MQFVVAGCDVVTGSAFRSAAEHPLACGSQSRQGALGVAVDPLLVLHQLLKEMQAPSRGARDGARELNVDFVGDGLELRGIESTEVATVNEVGEVPRVV